MPPNIIEIESEIDILRKDIPNNPNLDEAKKLICMAQTIMQKHIEKAYAPSLWQHTKTAAPCQSTYNLLPTGGND